MCDPDGASEKTTGDIDNSVVERQRRTVERSPADAAEKTDREPLN